MSVSPTNAGLQRSRVLGSYYASFVGDALGAPYEFKARDSYVVSSDYVVSKVFPVIMPLGGWTDDSSMMLCLLESFLECGGTWNADDCVRRWIQWMNEGYMSVIDKCFSIGTGISYTVFAVLQLMFLHRQGY
jgi:ADP-ribosyl-[dinitrogen reductase] hydrolase